MLKNNAIEGYTQVSRIGEVVSFGLKSNLRRVQKHLCKSQH